MAEGGKLKTSPVCFVAVVTHPVSRSLPPCGFMEVSELRTDHGANDLNVSQRLVTVALAVLEPPNPCAAMGAQT